MAKPKKPKIWTEAEKHKLAALAKRGAGVSKISAELGRYARSIRLMAREMGLLLKK
jgi:transposase-like protein